MRRVIVALAALLFALVPAGMAHAETSASPRNAGLTGMWMGTNTGFENGVFKSTDIRFSITAVNGAALTGTKSWRQADGTWSEPEAFQGVLYRSGEFHAVDNDGYIIGERVAPNRIRATYLEAGDDQGAFVLNLTKASRSARR